jgi:hypothetical protein
MRNHRTQLLIVIMLAGLALWMTSPNASDASAWEPLSDETRYYAVMSGAAIGGTTPQGLVEYRDTGSRRRLFINASSVNLAAGTSLSVRVNGATVGSMSVDSFANAALSLDTNNGNSVPVVAVGNTAEYLQGTTVILAGAFSATPPPTPSGSPGASPSPGVSPSPDPSPSGSPGATPSPDPSPSGSPGPSPSPGGSPGATPSPSPSGTPGAGNEIEATLSGPAINGVTPTGRAKFELESSLAAPESGRKLEVRAENVNLVAGTVLGVEVNGSAVGSMVLRSDGRAELRLFDSAAPLVVAGTTVAVKQGGNTVVSGTFSATPNPSPSPGGSPGATPSPSPSGSPGPTPSPGGTPGPTPSAGACTMSLSAASYSVNENAGSVTVTVNRACTQPQRSRVEFETQGGTAGTYYANDFTRASGRLDFEANETSKTFSVIIINDNIVENPEFFTVLLEDPRDGTLANPSRATVNIVDDDTAPPTTNPLEASQFFVTQHYADFLSRVPDAGGMDYWAGQIASCGTDAACIRARRIGVSAAFFVESEFQETGSYVYRMYRAALGRRPVFDEFGPDRARVVAGADLEQSKAVYADEFVLRPAFQAEYPANWIPEQFVSHLFDKAGLIGFADERQAEINAMYAGRTRAQVLRNVIELQAFRSREYNAAFVLMQYFGYLARDPDEAGYQFWLNILNQQPANARGMVCAFITSQEMQERFSAVAPRTNGECAGNP